MIRITRLLCMVFMLLVVACASAQSIPKYYLSSPLDFLESLKSYDNRFHTFIIEGKVKNWIGEEDVPLLLELLDSEVQCAGVMSSASGYIPGRSTIGDQAAYMIDGFRHRLYPPTLHSKSYEGWEKNDLKNWWLLYQQATDRGNNKNGVKQSKGTE